MSTKTISLKLEAYERLRLARRAPDESFSDVVMRAEWPEVGITARELREVYLAKGPVLGGDALDRVDAALDADHPPEDKWARP
ncbi:MAG TPA: antitoxin VapB family protein [Longimicrobiales bacterium]|nr:antitoxin VapB family protein [Longimicrobiales bacterium]